MRILKPNKSVGADKISGEMFPYPTRLFEISGNNSDLLGVWREAVVVPTAFITQCLGVSVQGVKDLYGRKFSL